VARIVVDVMLRKEIHDPQGEAIASAAHRLDLEPFALPDPEHLAGELLANPVIEEFTLHES
jgi:phosphoribosylformylglycinamidine (FGAM) synthase PurS component